jgi:aldose 1-epimerase
MSPSPQVFGRLPDGRFVEAYTLGNRAGASVRILTWGGIVQSLEVPDREGRLGDIVLGFKDLPPYLERHPYFGAITGRIAGRVRGAAFTLEDRRYELGANNGVNHTHGGFDGLDRRLWEAEPLPDALHLRYRSPDGEEGYPGNFDFTVTYRWTEASELIIDLEAVVDQVTPVNLTHHGYFNLAGEDEGFLGDHIVHIRAREYFLADESLVHTGERGPVTKANDFRKPRQMAEALPGLFQQHGDLYQLRATEPGRPRKVARVEHPGSGRALTVRTDEACLQFYTGSHLNGAWTGKSGTPYQRHAGFCLECQGFADALNTPGSGDILAHPGLPFRRRTIYAFSTL